MFIKTTFRFVLTANKVEIRNIVDRVSQSLIGVHPLSENHVMVTDDPDIANKWAERCKNKRNQAIILIATYPQDMRLMVYSGVHITTYADLKKVILSLPIQ